MEAAAWAMVRWLRTVQPVCYRVGQFDGLDQWVVGGSMMMTLTDGCVGSIATKDKRPWLYR